MKGRQIENVEVKVSVDSFARELELEVVEKGRGVNEKFVSAKAEKNRVCGDQRLHGAMQALL